MQAGGDGSAYDAERPQGRAVVAGRELQFALADPAHADSGEVASEALWEPGAAPCALVTHGAAGRAAALAEAWGRRVRVVALDALDPGTALADLAAGAWGLVVVGDGESWMRHAGLMRRIRTEGELLVAAECASELRTVAGERALPPFARARAGQGVARQHGARPRARRAAGMSAEARREADRRRPGQTVGRRRPTSRPPPAIA